MVEFDELALRNEFINTIRSGFAEYYDLLKTEVQVESEEPQEASYPCCLVSTVNPLNDKKYDDSNGSYQFVRLSIECDLYSNALEGLTARDSVTKLSQLLIKILLSKYKILDITRNQQVPFRTDIKRRVVDFAFTYDVANKIIYSN